jgi:hypothetical protein
MPKNIDKYAGDYQRIMARSRWELTYMQALDNSPQVAKWISEPKNLNISYLNPLDRRVHQYWPDFLVKYVDNSLELLEIKPLKESMAEAATSTYDKLMLIKNLSKWRAAEKFAKAIGARFRVITENELFKQKATRQPKRSRSTQGTVKPRGTRK